MDSGIYLITCSPPGELPRYYVGQSRTLRARLRTHKWSLGAGRHHNKKMQSAWDKYGAACFRFDVLELCESNALDEFEQWWLDETVGHRRVMNIGTTSGSAMRGVRFSAEHKQRISRALTGKKRASPMSNYLRQLVSQRFKGKPKTDEEKRKNAESQRGAKNHMFGRRGAGSPSAKSVMGRRLSDGAVIFLSCMKDGEALGFRSSKISQCCHGTRPHHRGYAWSFFSRPATS